MKRPVPPESVAQSQSQPKRRKETPVEPPKRRKDEKEEVMRVNKRLKELGQRKQGQRAFELFKANFGPLDGAGPLRPSVHSFTNLVNAFVRVGNVEQAKVVLSSMKTRGFEPNVVTYTTLLKGLCAQGSMLEAEQFESTIEGNERSLSTFLRGCLRWGTIDCALRRWKRVAGCCDDVSRECLVKTLCCALRVNTAREVLAGTTPSMVSTLALAEAELLLGHRKKCRALLATAKDAPIIDDSALDTSTHNFLQHKQQENQRMRQRLTQSKTPPNGITPLFRRFFYFRPQINSSTSSESLDKTCGNSLSSSSLPRALAKEIRGIGLRKTQMDEEEQWKTKCCTPNGLSLHALDQRPLKLEIGAGDGEWIVHRAPKDPSSVWAALELRYDRCARIWSKMCLQGVDNMFVLGGDAHHVVALLPSNSVAEVVSLYPEPPAWHEDAWDAGTPHLWTEKFLTILAEKMRISGELRICSDSQKYLELIKSYCPASFIAANGATIEVQAGRTDNSDTYFDRLWSNGRKRKRYNLCLRRM